MEPLSTMAIVGMAVQTVNSAIQLYKDKVPTWEQTELKQIFNKWEYLYDLFETELKKPRWEPGKDNTNARSEDALLNKRDALLRYGSQIPDKLRSIQG